MGNDKLNLQVTAKEEDIKGMFQDKSMHIKIINFNYLKEVNDLFTNVIKE